MDRVDFYCSNDIKSRLLKTERFEHECAVSGSVSAGASRIYLKSFQSVTTAYQQIECLMLAFRQLLRGIVCAS